MKTTLTPGILEALTLDSTYDHLTSLFGMKDIYPFYDWIVENYKVIDLADYDEVNNTLGLIEDMFGMYLMDITNWEVYMTINSTDPNF